MAKFTVTKENIHSANVDPSKVWQAMVGFAHYAFNKSHSVAYAIIAYACSIMWVYHRNEMLQYLLNDGTEGAIEMCKSLGMSLNYPSLYELGDSKYWIEKDENEHEVVHLPMQCDMIFQSYVDFLFNDYENVNIAQMIYCGVCDSLSGDRIALAELATTLLKKPRQQAAFMEPEGQKFERLEDILNGLKSCGAVVSWERNPEDMTILIKVQRANGHEPSEVLFYPNNSDQVRLQKCIYDRKMFGTIRNGVLSNMPWVEHERLKDRLEMIKQKLKDEGRDGQIYEQMRRYLQDHMRTYFNIPKKTDFYDVYAMLTDSIQYSRNTKIFLTFNNCSDLFYVTGDIAKTVLALPKNTLVKLGMRYSPFIKKRTEEYVYDLDILSLEPIVETGH